MHKKKRHGKYGNCAAIFGGNNKGGEATGGLEGERTGVVKRSNLAFMTF